MQSVNMSLSPLLVSGAPLFFHPPPPPSLSSRSYTGRRDLLGFLERKRLQYLLRRHSRKSFENSEEEKKKEDSKDSTSETDTPKEQDMMPFELEPADRIAEQIIYRAKNNIKIKRRQRRKNTLLNSTVAAGTCNNKPSTIIPSPLQSTTTKNKPNMSPLAAVTHTHGSPKQGGYHFRSPSLLMKVTEQQNCTNREQQMTRHHSGSSSSRTTVVVRLDSQSGSSQLDSSIISTNNNHCTDNDSTTLCPIVAAQQQKSVSTGGGVHYGGDIKVYHGLLYEQVRKEWRNTLTASRLKKRPINKWNSTVKVTNKYSNGIPNKQSSTDELKTLNDQQQKSSTDNHQMKSKISVAEMSSLAAREGSSKQNHSSINHTSNTRHKLTTNNSAANSNKQSISMINTTTKQRGGLIQYGYHEQLQKQKEKAKQDEAILKARQRLEIYALNVFMRELEEQKFKDASVKSDKV